jgi:hypothetical protein
MAHPPLVLCLSCHTPPQSDDPAVFREGVKIAHVRCWRLDHRPQPSRHVDPVARPTQIP